MACLDIFTMGVKMCESKFKKLYDKCKKKVKLKVLCLPVKLGALCKMVRGEMHDHTFIQKYLSPVKFVTFKACMVLGKRNRVVVCCSLRPGWRQLQLHGCVQSRSW